MKAAIILPLILVTMVLQTGVLWRHDSMLQHAHPGAQPHALSQTRGPRRAPRLSGSTAPRQLRALFIYMSSALQELFVNQQRRPGTHLYGSHDDEMEERVMQSLVCALCGQISANPRLAIKHEQRCAQLWLCGFVQDPKVSLAQWSALITCCRGFLVAARAPVLCLFDKVLKLFPNSSAAQPAFVSSP